MVDGLQIAEELRQRAVAANGAGRSRDAAALLNEALRHLDIAGSAIDAAEATAARCNLMITSAVSEFLLSGSTRGLRRLQEAEDLADQLDDDRLRARVAFQRSHLLGRMNDLHGSWAHLQTAAERPEAFSPREQVVLLINRGMLALELIRIDDALASFREAGRVAHRQGWATEQRRARHNEGHALFLAGDLPGSLAVLASAEAMPGELPIGRVTVDRAKVMLEAGLSREAVALLDGAAGCLDPIQSGHLAAEIDLELAHAHRLLGRHDSARTRAEAALRLFNAHGLHGWAARCELVMLEVEMDEARRSRSLDHTGHASGSSARPAHDFQLAVERADALVDRATAVGDEALVQSARLTGAEAALLAADVGGAATRLAGSIDAFAGTVSDELHAVSVAAGVQVATGQGVAARRLLRRAARRLGAAKRGSASLDLRTAQALHGVGLAALDLDLAVPRGSAAVLDALERWRGTADRLPSLGRPADSRLAELTEALRAVRSRQRTSDTRPGGLALDALDEQASLLEQQIRDRDWSLSSELAQGGRDSVPIREAISVLADRDRDLVWFFTHQHRLCGVAVIHGRRTLRDLGPLPAVTALAQRIRADLRTAATQRLGPFADSVWGSLRSCASELDRIAVRPWRTGRPLVIVTCPELSALPWALLPSLVGRPVTTTASLTAYAMRETRPTTVLAVHVGVGPGLVRATTEAREVGRTWRSAGARVRVDDPCDGPSLRAALSGPGLVHVAAHGRHQPESPLFSSVVLHDGPVFAHELQSSGVAADHVVLSACDVGTSHFRPGDEQLGLAAAMLALGARSVVAAVAPVPDDVAAAAMTAHHESLARGASSDEALAQAIASTDPVAAAFLNLGGRFVP